MSESTEFMRRLGFPADAIETLETARRSLQAQKELLPLFRAAEEAIFCHGKGDFRMFLAEIAERSGIRRETADMVFLISCLPRLLEEYQKHDIPEKIFRDSMDDLRCKLWECYRVRGIWGTFVTEWYPGFYRLERFALGRLQYEHTAFPFDNVPGLKQGQTVYNCHIPSSGPLTPGSVSDSLARAKAFFANELNGGGMPVYCHSWLLYPPIVALFSENSNLRRFAERFTLLKSIPDPENQSFWRIFDRPWEPGIVVSDLPDDTSLRRTLKAFFQCGNTMGFGEAILWA